MVVLTLLDFEMVCWVSDVTPIRRSQIERVCDHFPDTIFYELEYVEDFRGVTGLASSELPDPPSQLECRSSGGNLETE